MLEIATVETNRTESGHPEVVRIKGVCNGLSWSHSYSDAVRNIQERSFAYFIRKNNTCLALGVEKNCRRWRPVKNHGRPGQSIELVQLSLQAGHSAIGPAAGMQLRLLQK